MPARRVAPPAAVPERTDRPLAEYLPLRRFPLQRRGYGPRLHVPFIAAGAYGYPIDQAARIAVGTLRSAETEVQEVLLVDIYHQTRRRYEAALAV